MKKIMLIALLFLKVSVSFSQHQITGKWLTQDNDAIIEITERQGKFFGKIVWLKEPNDKKGVPFTDTENPNPALRQQPLIGLEILKNCYFQKNEWKGGSTYDPQTGKNYDCTLWLSDNNTLKFRGYWGYFYLTQTWKRTK
ncbi:MAG: hypothetical protein RL757_2614 [Bacteroidota bacterium]|jgi:uncharacterized protein (DUF2147 family)